MENLSVEGLVFSPDSREHSCVFDFSGMQETSYVKNLRLSGATLENVGKIYDVDSRCSCFELSQNDVHSALK